ncbi:hypothetical protein RIM94_26660, partial [Pseudomonas aeruginosa]
DHLLHRFGPELICVLLAVAHKHLGHCHQLWQPDVYERLAGPHLCLSACSGARKSLAIPSIPLASCRHTLSASGLFSLLYAKARTCIWGDVVLGVKLIDVFLLDLQQQFPAFCVFENIEFEAIRPVSLPSRLKEPVPVSTLSQVTLVFTPSVSEVACRSYVPFPRL